MGIITNIKSLQRMGIYADRSARSPSLQFRRYNLVYGFNGSGKSTLSRIFASLQAGKVHPKLPEGSAFELALDHGSAFGCPINPVGLEQRVLVFSSDYIEQNLQWAAGRANPVFYIGAEQAGLPDKAAPLSDNIVRARPCSPLIARARTRFRWKAGRTGKHIRQGLRSVDSLRSSLGFDHARRSDADSFWPAKISRTRASSLFRPDLGR